MSLLSSDAQDAWRAVKRDPQLAAFPVLALLLFGGMSIMTFWLWTHAGKFFAAHGLEAMWFPTIVLPLAWTILAPLALLEATVAIRVHDLSRGTSPSFARTLVTLTRQSPRLVGWVALESLGAALFVALARSVGRITSIAGASAASYATTFVIAHLATTSATIREALRASGQALVRSSGSLRAVTPGTVPGLLMLCVLFLGTPFALIVTLSLAERYPGIPTWLQNAAIASPIILFIFLSLYALLAHFLHKIRVYERQVHRQYPADGTEYHQNGELQGRPSPGGQPRGGEDVRYPTKPPS